LHAVVIAYTKPWKEGLIESMFTVFLTVHCIRGGKYQYFSRSWFFVSFLFWCN